MSQIGSGAMPVAVLPCAAVRISSARARRDRDGHVQALQRSLRKLPIPILGRIEDHALLLDYCRCLDDLEASTLTSSANRRTRAA